MTNNPAASEPLEARINKKLDSIQRYIETTEPVGNRLTTFNIVCGALATLLAALPAIGGETFLDVFGTVGSSQTPWRVLFAATALFSLLSTIAANLYKSRDIASRLARAQAARAKLEGLSTRVEVGMFDAHVMSAEYEQIISEIPFIPGRVQTARSGRLELDDVRGVIDAPSPYQEVGTVIRCAGTVEGAWPGCHLWLAVEVDGFIWPKEREIQVSGDGRWSDNVFEQGSSATFAIALYAANDKANKRIRAWMDRGDDSGQYERLRRLADTRRLALVDGLRPHTSGPRQ